jgi:hypothetical protein
VDNRSSNERYKMNSFYVYISSGDSLQYYKNKAYDFTVYLPESLKTRSRQHWVVALAEIQYTLTGDIKSNMIEVYTDICSSSIIHGKKKTILRNITVQNFALNSVTLHKNFNPIIYVPVNKSEIRQIRVYISTATGSRATFIAGITKCTLHFKLESKK